MLLAASKILRRTVTTSLALVFAAAVGPVVYEGLHNQKQQDMIDASVAKLAQEKFFICNPAAAAPQEENRGQQLQSILAKAAGTEKTGWDSPLMLYKSGLKRITNNFPDITAFSRKVFGDIPHEYFDGHYRTPLDAARRNVEELAKLGIGICFDKDIASLKAGSIYVREEGMIILNPSMPEAALVTHVARHLSRLDQELMKPYDRLVSSGQENRSAFSDRVAQLKTFVGLLEGNNLMLESDGNPNTVKFVEVPKSTYKTTVLMRQPVATAKSADKASAAEKAASAALQVIKKK